MTVTSQAQAGVSTRAGAAVVARHSELRQVLDQWAAVLTAAAASGDPVRPARSLLRVFLVDELLPHIRAEERTLYPAARRDPRTRPLVQALAAEHRALASRTAQLATLTQPAAVAAAARAISALFASHAAKENSLLLPALERSGAGLARLLAREDLLAGIR